MHDRGSGRNRALEPYGARVCIRQVRAGEEMSREHLRAAAHILKQLLGEIEAGRVRSSARTTSLVRGAMVALEQAGSRKKRRPSGRRV